MSVIAGIFFSFLAFVLFPFSQTLLIRHWRIQRFVNSWHSALRKHLLKVIKSSIFCFRDGNGDRDNPLMKKVIIDDENDSKESDNIMEDAVIGLSYQVWI